MRVAALAVVALSLASSCSHERVAQPPAASGPPIILFTVDTERADHLSLYGYDRDTAPSLTRLAQDAVTFTRAFTPAPKTTPAFASMFTGSHPHRHGLQMLGQELAAENRTVAELLAEQGYDAAAFVSSTVMINRLSGLGQGFAHWDDRLPTREANRENYERTARPTVDTVLDWLPDWLSDRHDNLFLFVHLIDPHGPYRPPGMFHLRFVSRKGDYLDGIDVPEFQRIPGAIVVGDYIDAYDGEIAYADQQLGRLLDELRARGIYDRALVIFTSDHGESLGEDGVYFRHGKTLHEASTRVPLVIKPPGGRAPGVEPRWDGAVSLVDIMPTLVDFAGQAVPAAIDGRSLRSIVEGRGGDSDRIVFSERRTQGGASWAAHGAHGTVYMTECPRDAAMGDCEDRYLAKRRSGAVLEIDASTATRGALRGALDEFIKGASDHRPPFVVTFRYRPGNKEFVRRFVAEHNTSWETYATKDLDALQQLGYMD